MANAATVEQDSRQLTIRLAEDVINKLEEIARVLQKTAPPGLTYTRTDALRTVIFRGIQAITDESSPAAPARVPTNGGGGSSGSEKKRKR